MIILCLKRDLVSVYSYIFLQNSSKKLAGTTNLLANQNCHYIIDRTVARCVASFDWSSEILYIVSVCNERFHWLNGLIQDYTVHVSW